MEERDSSCWKNAHHVSGDWWSAWMAATKMARLDWMAGGEAVVPGLAT